MSAGNELQGLQEAFAADAVRFTPLGLEMPEGLSKEANGDLGRRLLRADQVLQWYVGDWANHWERKYGDLKEFCEVNGFVYQTVMNRAAVCGAVKVSLRRESLAWSHHEVVAALKPAEQRQWLARADAEHLTVAKLRAQINLARCEQSALVSDGPVVMFAGAKATDELLRFLAGWEDWPAERRAAVRELLRPIVEVFNSLESKV